MTDTTDTTAQPRQYTKFEPPLLPPYPDDPKARTAYLKALCAFQSEAIALPKDKDGHSYKYTDLASALSTLRPLLAKHGLVLTFRSWTVQWGMLGVIALLEHVDGWHQSTQLVSKVTDGMSKRRDGGWSMSLSQGQGAVQTYMCRYAMMALLGLTAAIDTDGSEKPGPDDDF